MMTGDDGNAEVVSTEYPCTPGCSVVRVNYGET